MPRVSVIIPTYNRAGQVGKAIASVLSQSFTDLELIVVDDGSTDHTGEVVVELAATDSRVRYVGQPNQGRSAARNAGIRMSRGDYVAFLDSDDQFLPNKLQRQIDAFEQNPELGMVYHPPVMVDDMGQPLYGGAPLPGQMSGWIYPELLFIKGTIIATPSVMVRRDVLAQVGVFDESMHVCEDLDLWRRVARYHPVLQLEDPLAVICYRRNEPLALAEKVQARLHYYRKAVADDPGLRRAVWPKLLGEMYWAYGALAIHYRHWWPGLPLLARSVWYDPVEFGHFVLSGASRRWALIAANWRSSVANWTSGAANWTSGVANWTRGVQGRWQNARVRVGQPARRVGRMPVPKLASLAEMQVSARSKMASTRAALRQLRRQLFNLTIGLVVRTFPLQVADRLARIVTNRMGDPAQAAFAQHGFRLVRLDQLDQQSLSPAVADQPLVRFPTDTEQAEVVTAVGADSLATAKPDILASAEKLATQLAQQPGNPAYETFYRNGFHLLRRHFYLPIPDRADLQNGFAAQPSALAGLEMNDEVCLGLMEQVFSAHMDEFRALFPLQLTADPRRFYLLNSNYMAVDAHVYFAMIRHFKPRKIIEIGAGFSTLLAAAACVRNSEMDGRPAQLVAIEPYPFEVLRTGLPGLSQLMQCKVQDVDPALFAALEAGDILFIDSSHALRTGGDVQLEYLEILPRLAPGVLVHIHDISLPKPYPAVYFEYQFFWNEQYLLQAFLAFNQRFEVVWPGNYMMENYPERVRAVFPEFQVMRQYYPQSEPSAFWMRVRTPPAAAYSKQSGESK